jgi:hypothetical protein
MSEQDRFNASSSSGGSRPVPDPTVLTTDAVNQAIAVTKDYTDGKIAVLEERLRGIDKATTLLNEEVNRVPSKLTLAVEQVYVVTGEKFASVDKQFKERDIRAEREARDNKVAVDAAFAAQKEAAAKQDEANAKAIDKSEKATAETIKTNQDATIQRLAELTKSQDEMKIALSRLETSKLNATESRTEQRASTGAVTGYIFGAVASVVAVAALLVTIYLASQPG